MAAGVATGMACTAAVRAAVPIVRAAVTVDRSTLWRAPSSASSSGASSQRHSEQPTGTTASTHVPEST